MSYTIAVVVGSIRRESFNRQLALALQPLAPGSLKLEIVRIDAERQLLLVKGSVPGSSGRDVVVQLAAKGQRAAAKAQAPKAAPKAEPKAAAPKAEAKPAAKPAAKQPAPKA